MPITAAYDNCIPIWVIPWAFVNTKTKIPAAIEFNVKNDNAKYLPIKYIEKNKVALSIEGLAFAIKV